MKKITLTIIKGGRGLCCDEIDTKTLRELYVAIKNELKARNDKKY